MKLDKFAVLIVDDLGYVKKNEQETSVLFELIAHRYESASLIVTANQPFSDWDQVFTDTMRLARQALKLPDALAKLDKFAVLIVDDLGYVKKNEQETSVLFELIAHRYESASLIVTANQPFSDWDQVFTDTMMTVAAVDRLIHHATIIELNNDSYRRREAAAKAA